MSQNSTWLIVGLGNPGTDYDHTRHNVGFDVIDFIASEIGANYWKAECGALVANKEWDNQNIILAKPQSFMNLSGSPISQLAKKYSVEASHIIVIHDDLDMETGRIRLRLGGGAGGHNGLKSTFDKLGTQDFIRVKVGIGRPPGRMSVSDYVLSRPSKDDVELLAVAYATAADATLYLLRHGIELAQTNFN